MATMMLESNILRRIYAVILPVRIGWLHDSRFVDWDMAFGGRSYYWNTRTLSVQFVD